MNMTNVNVLIKPDETVLDIIAEICDECGIGPNEPFAFSAIVAPDKQDPEFSRLKINCIEPQKDNPYTVELLVRKLFVSARPSPTGVKYIQPPIEQWLTVFRPLLMRIVARTHPRYERLIPDREELISIIFLVVMRLYNQGYYLHQTLIQKSFVNELNMECRKLKGLAKTDSLDAPIGEDDDGKEITLLDQIADPEPSPFEYTDDDYWATMYERIKSRMIDDMGEFAFNRIMLQLRTHTVDTKTSRILDEYRQLFNPGYVPRPNAKGKAKGGNKK